LAAAAAIALLLAGCSSPATPSLFPSVLNEPPPHEDTTLQPEQVKQAVDSLVSERNHLCSATADPATRNTAHCGEAAAGAQTAGAAAKP